MYTAGQKRRNKRYYLKHKNTKKYKDARSAYRKRHYKESEKEQKQQKEWQLNNPEKCKAARKKYYKKNNAVLRSKALKKYKENMTDRMKQVQYVVNQIRYRANKNNIPCDIDADYVHSITPTHCPILNIELTFGTGLNCSTTASIDRIIPSKGYIKGNIQVISWRANRIKSDATIEELEKLINYLKIHAPNL